MLIALDYDGTYTAAPDLWAHFIGQATTAGHEVVVVTMRFAHEPIDVPCEVIYTARSPKGPFMASLGRVPAVWIDDKPHWIFRA